MSDFDEFSETSEIVYKSFHCFNRRELCCGVGYNTFALTWTILVIILLHYYYILASR